MEQLPETEDPLVLRTDFSNSAVWDAICEAIQEPVGEFRAYVDFINDAQYEGLTLERMLSLIPEHSKHTFIFIVDNETVSHAENPILVVDLYKEPGRTFRVIPPKCGASKIIFQQQIWILRSLLMKQMKIVFIVASRKSDLYKTVLSTASIKL